MKNDFLPLPSTTAFSQLGQEKINLNQLIRLNRVEGMMMMGGGGRKYEVTNKYTN